MGLIQQSENHTKSQGFDSRTQFQHTIDILSICFWSDLRNSIFNFQNCPVYKMHVDLLSCYYYMFPWWATKMSHFIVLCS